MNPLFSSEAAKNEILGIYDQKLAELNIEYQSTYLTTKFGNTHILITGNPANPPLLLIHGSNGCAPIGLECYPNLTKKYQVFAIDVLAQPNKSDGTRLSMKDESYGKWTHEIIQKLNLKEVTLAGFSFGGLIILKTLAFSASNIKQAFLASPAYIVNGNPLKALFKVFIPMRRYMSTQKMRFLEKFLAEVFTERDDFAVNFLSKVFLHFNMDFTPVPVISKKEAQKITTPFNLLAAKNDVMFPGEKMIKRARKLFPTMRQSILLNHSKHVQDKEGNLLFEELILG
ncbi:MAG: alpha/beta hydrolase [Saprospiraceae bacterium]|nr:alpha/beta hydrolase [Saprospiraceae bacterium]